MRLRLTGRKVALVSGIVSLALLTSAAPSSYAGSPGVERAVTSTKAAVAANPLKGRPWGVYKGSGEPAWKPYVDSTGTNRALLAKIALRPKARWFGAWISNANITKSVQAYIANSTGGDPNVLVQMTVFRMVPWEHAACSRLPTAAEKTSYYQWIRRFVNAIGSAHVALILQPDGPFALCVPKASTVPSHLIAYAARKFSALPHTSVYIDGGASDWPKDDPAKAATFLVPAGIKYARGFALNSTHYATTSEQVKFGTGLVSVLNGRGYPDKRFVINTSSNGRGFDFGSAKGSHPDNADVCATPHSTSCVTLGIPPTTDVANTKWHLSATNRKKAAKYVDAYLWFGRPWLFMQSSPFALNRALALASSTPY